MKKVLYSLLIAVRLRNILEEALTSSFLCILTCQSLELSVHHGLAAQQLKYVWWSSNYQF